MKHIYIKPECEVVVVEHGFMSLSVVDVETAGKGTDAKPDAPDYGTEKDPVPDFSKGGFPWSDDFDFHID